MRYLRRNLLVIFFIAASFVTGAAQSAEMSASIASNVIKMEQQFSINISIDPAGSSITAAQFNLDFNSSLVKINNITEGYFFKQQGANTAFSPGNLNNTDGTLINVWGLIITPGANVLKKGVMATITMTATGTGIAYLNISNVIISDPSSHSVSVNITNVSIDIISYDTSPPGSIMNLKNTSYAKDYINWTWSDPSDADFSKVIIYINDTFKINVSKGIQYYNATGLIPGTVYTINTRTVDIAGNLNNTQVNHSAGTLPVNEKPIVTIISPTNGQVFTTSSITASGTATDNVAVIKVEVKVGAGVWQTASGTISWIIPAVLSAGSNTIYARANDTSGNSNETSITVTYNPPENVTTPDTVPPGSITNLQSISISKSYLKWTWIDPQDPDFSKVMIYIDGKFKTNVTRGVQYYSSRSLKSSTLHTISTRTVDMAGNINNTWVNNSARTAAFKI